MTGLRARRHLGVGALFVLALAGVAATRASADGWYCGDLPPRIYVEVTVRVIPPTHGGPWACGYYPYGCAPCRQWVDPRWLPPDLYAEWAIQSVIHRRLRAMDYWAGRWDEYIRQ